MLAVAGKRVQSCAVDGVHPHIRGLGARDQVAQPRVLPPREHVQFVHSISPLAQPRGDRMEAEQGASGLHRRLS
jgi:hypothetical protein